MDDLPDEVAAAMAAGDEVLVERDGKVVAVLAPRAERKGDIHALVEALRALPPLDEDFERDLATAREWLNRPVEEPRWVP